ncbi:type IV secretion protein Rhs, partial [Shigella sonnei]|nr:type IV secretion protein Rhs [Shigella sonnei]
AAQPDGHTLARLWGALRRISG